MKESFSKILQGYKKFREKYVLGDSSVMQYLADYGQQPQVMVVACCDARVDPALILQCEPGDLFVVRNVANIIPPYEKDNKHHGTSAALEFGICVLKVKHVILLGHSQCGGIQALLANDLAQNDFITNWVSIVKTHDFHIQDIDDCAKLSLDQSYQNCLTFPWINDKVIHKKIIIHRWFFDIRTGQIFTYGNETQKYSPLGR